MLVDNYDERSAYPYDVEDTGSYLYAVPLTPKEIRTFVGNSAKVVESLLAKNQKGN